MKLSTLTLFLCTLLLQTFTVSAQDLTITNARIIITDGEVIENGSIVINDGRITYVAAGTPRNPVGNIIDAQGMTAVPGFIDAHRHINTGPDEAEKMQVLLEAGYTTILSGGGPAEGNITLREHIEKGLINGPRIIPSGRISLNQSPEDARAQVRELADLGIKFTGEMALTSFPRPYIRELETLTAIVDEAVKVGITVQVHSVSAQATMAATRAGVKRLVHTTNKNFLTRDEAREIAEAGVMVLSLAGFGAPVFNVFNNDNIPTFRNGDVYPDSIPQTTRVPELRLGQEAGHVQVNLRTMWDAGVIVGYCTDTSFDALAGLAHELKVLNVMFSSIDLVRLMGPNTAAYINMADDLGELAPGKLADIVLLDGDPLEGYWNLLRSKVVVKEGRVVVDKR